MATWSNHAAADPPADQPNHDPSHEYRVGLFDDLGQNIVDSLTGYNLIWYGLAIGSTAVLSASGADDAVQRWIWDGHTLVGGETAGDVVYVAGWLTPVVIPGALTLTGLANADSEAASAGMTALQAVGINAGVTMLAKLITGRPLPYEDGEPSDDDELFSIKRSRSGREWGFVLRGGVAWPSGHTSAHMALASSLVAFYPDEVWLPFIAYPIVAFVGLAMIDGDEHWVSDVVAGALVGHAVGWTVGKNMRRRYDAENGKPSEETSSVNVQPLVLRDGFMLVLSL